MKPFCIENENKTKIEEENIIEERGKRNKRDSNNKREKFYRVILLLY